MVREKIRDQKWENMRDVKRREASVWEWRKKEIDKNGRIQEKMAESREV